MNTNLRLIALLASIGLMLSLSIVFLVSRKSKNRDSYFMIIANKTFSNLEQVRLECEGKTIAAFGHVVPGGIARYGPVTHDLSNRLKVIWCEDGICHEVNTPAPKVTITSSKAWNVYFFIQENSSVVVEVLDKDNATNNASAVKALVRFRRARS